MKKNLNRFDPTSEDNAPQSRELAKFSILRICKFFFDYFVNSQKKKKTRAKEENDTIGL